MDSSDDGLDIEPTEVLLLSTGSLTKDEDPSVILAQDGKLFVAWFSDRGGNSDIYLNTTPNGKDWRTPIRVTTSPEGDFYPNLLQDDRGFFHLTWFRWDAPFHGHIWYNSSSDGVTWDPRTAVQVTAAADVDDWVPTITQAADGTFLIYFVSQLRDAANPTSDIYLAARRPGEVNWDPAIPVTGVNSPTEHDHLPFEEAPVARTSASLSIDFGPRGPDVFIMARRPVRP